MGGDLELTPTLAGHLDGCLGCHNCERVCPSGVAYGQIADTAKTFRVKDMSALRRAIDRLLLAALSSASIMRALSALAVVYRAFLKRADHLDPWDRLLSGHFSGFHPYHRLAVAMQAPWRGVKSGSASQTDCELFLGCMGAATQSATVEATLRVMEALRIGVRIRRANKCCGAMHGHHGYPEQANARLTACAGGSAGIPLIGLASACVAQLRTHPALTRTQELCAFLDTLHWPKEVRLQRLPLHVWVHEPCTHRNQLGGNQAVHRLLGRVPGLKLGEFPPAYGCCGAAGTHFLRHPDMAKALLSELLRPLQDARPDWVVTTNPGCALHLAAGLREVGLNTRVGHPVELIAAALSLPRR